MERISRNKGKTFQMTLALKRTLEEGFKVGVITKEENPINLLNRLADVGMMAQAEPIYVTNMNEPIFDFDSGIIGYKRSIKKKTGFKLTKCNGI